MATVARADAIRPSVHWAGRQTLLVFVLVWSATQAAARNAPAGLSVANSHRGRLQMPLQKAATLRDLCPARGAGPAWASLASLSIAVIVTLAEAPVRLAIEHSTSAPPPAVTGAEPSVAAAAGGAARVIATAAASQGRLGMGRVIIGPPPGEAGFVASSRPDLRPVPSRPQPVFGTPRAGPRAPRDARADGGRPRRAGVAQQRISALGR